MLAKIQAVLCVHTHPAWVSKWVLRQRDSHVVLLSANSHHQHPLHGEESFQASSACCEETSQKKENTSFSFTNHSFLHKKKKHILFPLAQFSCIKPCRVTSVSQTSGLIPVELFSTWPFPHVVLSPCSRCGMRFTVVGEVHVEAEPSVKGKPATWPALDSGHHYTSQGVWEVKVLQGTVWAHSGRHGWNHPDDSSTVGVHLPNHCAIVLIQSEQSDQALQLLWPQTQGAQILQEAQQRICTLPVQTLGLWEHLQQSTDHAGLHGHGSTGQGAAADGSKPLGHQQLEVPLTRQVRQPVQEQQQRLLITNAKVMSVHVLALHCLETEGDENNQHYLNRNKVINKSKLTSLVSKGRVIMRKCAFHHVHQLLQQPFGGLTLTLQHIKQLGVTNPLLENLLRGRRQK